MSKVSWVMCNDKDRIPEPDAMAQHLFREGDKVGEFAKKFYPEGINISFGDFKNNLEKSKELLKEKKPLFEPGFIFQDCYARADIIVPVGDEWDIIEVKSSSHVKDIHIHDVSFQKHVYEGAGLKIRNCYLMHMNSDYVREGEIDVKELFNLEDITEKVKLFSEGIIDRITLMLELINAKTDPRKDIGAHCKTPYICPLTKVCWNHLPESHVFTLYRGGPRSVELYESGVHAIKDIPDKFKLTSKQDVQKNAKLVVKSIFLKNI